MTSRLRPGKDDLCARRIVLLSNGLDGGVSDEQGQAEAVVAKGRVSSDVDSLLLGKGDECIVLQEAGVPLDLVDGRDDTGGLDDGLEVLNGEVGHADVLHLALGQGNDGLPRVDQGHAVVDGNLIGLVLGLGEQHLADGALQGERHRPVDQVEVEVVQLQLGEGVVQGLLDVLRAVGVVPQLGGDEEVLALDAELLDALVQALGNLLLVLVDLGQIEVAVASLEGLVDAYRDLTGGRLPCAIAEGAVQAAGSGVSRC